ncbi:MAG TPA: hypothetical protein VM734_01220, partial [Kofleriaceae bacterium]|nr:hypothetical protein [Kofleriaceae bacterium]
MRTRLLSLLLVGTAACSFEGSATPDGPISPVDASDPEVDADPDAPIDAPCAARCESDDLITCAAGVEQPPQTCAIGCSTTGGPHCQEIIPSNGAT